MIRNISFGGELKRNLLIGLIFITCLFAGVSFVYSTVGHDSESKVEQGDNDPHTAQEPSRSPHWEATQKEHLVIDPACNWCGNSKNLNVHHIKPFHVYPELELVQSNLITLCRWCHFAIGHECNWKNENLYVKEDCENHRKLKAGKHEKEDKK